MRGSRRLQTAVVAAISLAFGSQPQAEEPAWPSLPTLARAMAALPPHATLVAFHPEGANAVFLAQKLAASAALLAPLLGDAAAYQKAIPVFVRADVAATRARGEWQDTQVAWELEIPLRNLAGTLWFKPFDHALQIRLASGSFVPGQLLWRWLSLPSQRDTPQTLLVLHGTANTRDANFATRRIAARSPLAEPAMTMAASYTLIEAMVDAALSRAGARHPRRWPEASTQPPALAALMPPLSTVAQQLKFSGPLGLVMRRSNGRLDHVQIAVWSPLPPQAAVKRLAQPTTWRALPGWKRIDAGQKVAVAGASDAKPKQDVQLPVYQQRWQVDASFPFLDFDASWEVVVTSELQATAVDGAAQGAVWKWQALPAADGDSPGKSLLIFSVYPRVDKLGFIPRKFIEKEPLLEAGLSLALAYVNGISLAHSLPAVVPDGQ